MLAITPHREIVMTAIITDCKEVIETRIVDQVSGNTIKTNYFPCINTAVNYAEQFNPDRIEFDTL